MKSNVAKHLDSSDIKKVFWRAFLLPSCYSMDRMQAPGYAYSMIPVLEKLYSDDKEKLAEACSRHSEVYNNTFAMSPLVLGISSAMEEEAANNEEFDVSSINNIKVALMGPLAGIGDTFFWGTFRIIGSGIGISLAQQGSILGPLLFLLIYNIPHILVRIYGIKLGYKFGGKSIEAISAGGLMNKATRAATVMGLTVIGGMIVSMVNVKLGLVLQLGNGVELSLQSILNDICPAILPLGLTFAIYYMLKKGVKPVSIMLGIIVFGVAAKFFGIM